MEEKFAAVSLWIQRLKALANRNILVPWRALVYVFPVFFFEQIGDKQKHA
jgi:hypothetical protein